MFGISATTALAAVGAGAAVYSAVQSGNAADSQAQAADATTAVSQNQLQLAREQWDTYKQYALPVLSQLSGQVKDTPAQPDYATVERTARETQQNAADTQWNDISRRRQDTGGSAWNPGSTNYNAALTQWGNQSAANSALAQQQAHTAEKYRVEDLNWNRPLALYQALQGIPGTSASTAGSAGALAGSAASQFGNIASTQSNNAAMGLYGAGKALTGWGNNTGGGTLPFQSSTAAPVSTGTASMNPGVDSFNGNFSGPAPDFASAADGGSTDRIQARAMHRGALHMADGGEAEIDAGTPPAASSITQLQPEDESRFQAWYGVHAKNLGMHPNPDDPGHLYDYRKAFVAGANPSESGGWPADHVMPGHPAAAPATAIDSPNASVPGAGDSDKTSALHMYAQGGVVKGPGNGTSDSVPARLPKDAYVVPADVVKAKGTDFFDKLHGGKGALQFHPNHPGNSVDADISNHEYVVAPHVVKKKGIEFFDKLLEKYHTPTSTSAGAEPGGSQKRIALPLSIESAIRGNSHRSALGSH